MQHASTKHHWRIQLTPPARKRRKRFTTRIWGSQHPEANVSIGLYLRPVNFKQRAGVTPSAYDSGDHVHKAIIADPSPRYRTTCSWGGECYNA